MKIAKQMSVAFCPDCDEEIDFSQTTPKVGLKLICPHCETNLEIINVNPLKLDWDDSIFFDDDWDDDEDW
jgi:Zn finger protein HypA/HybF involved in hydrogenase expression